MNHFSSIFCPNTYLSMPFDIRTTRLYDFLAHLPPRYRKSISALSEIKLITIKNKELELLKEILTHINKNNKKPLHKQALAKKINLSEEKIHYLTSSLFKKIGSTLPFFLLKDSDLETTHILTKFFLNYHWSEHTSLVLKANKTVLEKKQIRTHDFHFYEMKHHEFCTKQDSINRTYHQGINDMNQSLDAFYAENKLRIFCEELNRNRILGEASQIAQNDSFKASFLNMIQEEEFFESPSVELFFHVYNMLIKNSEKSYLQVFKLLERYKQLFHPDLEETVLRYLMNQSIIFINSSDNHQTYANQYLNYVNRLHELGKLILANQQYPLGIFHNIVLASTKVKSKAWCINFVETTIPTLNTPNRTCNRIIHLAHIELRFGNYQAAHHLIAKLDDIDNPQHQVPKEDIFLSLFYYQLSIQIFFKTTDDLSSTPFQKNDALRKYIQRKHENFSNSKKEKLDNFVAFTRRIINTPKGFSKWKSLTKEISEKRTQIAYIDSIHFMLKHRW